MRSAFASYWKGLIYSALFLFLLPFLSGCGHFFYYPDRVFYFDLKKNNIEYEEVRFKSQDGTELVGWYFKSKKPSAEVILHFHGNAQNISAHFGQLYWVTRYGYDYFIMDYRGYGLSQGRPNHKGVQDDIVAAIQFALSKKTSLGIAPKKIVLYGQSLGGASVLGAFDDIQDKTKIKAIVVEGGFASYKKIARRKLSEFWLTWPVQWLPYLVLSDKYSGKKNISKIAPIPLLVVHGTSDRVVDFEEGQYIFSHAQEPKALWAIEGADHLWTYFIKNGLYQEKLVEYLNGLPN